MRNDPRLTPPQPPASNEAEVHELIFAFKVRIRQSKLKLGLLHVVAAVGETFFRIAIPALQDIVGGTVTALRVTVDHAEPSEE